MKQIHRVLGATTTRSLTDYLDNGGGTGLAAARRLAPDDLVGTIERAGLRGRGGAGFPTGKKWRTLAQLATDTGLEIPVIINAAEGEPGTFKDRSLLRTNPYLVLEGAAIAARAIGATDIIVGTKASFSVEIERLLGAISEIESSGWLPGITVDVVTGPSEYLFGEETALLEVIDGRPPLPRIAPPFRRGVNEHPTDTESSGWGRGGRRGDGPGALIDNVETLAAVTGILHHGVDWFREIGTAASPGSVICTVTGSTKFHGVGEFAMGTTVREVIRVLGGGARPGHHITAVLNGVSNPPILPDQLDTPLTYEDMSAIGSGLGSASLIVIDDSTPLLAVAAGVARFLAIESCGQCEPCKRDGLDLTESLGAATTSGAHIDERHVSDRLRTVARGARCALAGQTERVVGQLVALAGPEDRRSATPYPIAPLIEIDGSVAVIDTAHLEKRSDWTYPSDGEFSNAWPVQRLADQPVEITSGHSKSERASSSTFEKTSSGDQIETDDFEAVSQLGRELSQQLDELRVCVPDERQHRLDTLRDDIERYQQATERFVYPALERLDADSGADIAWYPEHHTQAAARLVRDLDLGAIPVSPRLVDQLCADVHASIIEVELRVLPLIERALAAAKIEANMLALGVDDVIES